MKLVMNVLSQKDLLIYRQDFFFILGSISRNNEPFVHYFIPQNPHRQKINNDKNYFLKNVREKYCNSIYKRMNSHQDPKYFCQYAEIGLVYFRIQVGKALAPHQHLDRKRKEQKKGIFVFWNAASTLLK